jgi:hypothetical protein
MINHRTIHCVLQGLDRHQVWCDRVVELALTLQEARHKVETSKANETLDELPGTAACTATTHVASERPCTANGTSPAFSSQVSAHNVHQVDTQPPSPAQQLALADVHQKLAPPPSVASDGAPHAMASADAASLQALLQLPPADSLWSDSESDSGSVPTAGA